jgi:myo-inositol-1(or 4)-monophosphatase
MTKSESENQLAAFLSVAEQAAREAGALIASNYGEEKTVNELKRYDIKLEMDVKSQELITGILLGAFPQHALYGEEGIAGQQDSPYQWIVDPIDGTVNYFYGIPHFCVSIALRHQGEVILGVIYDPMMREMFVAQKGKSPTLNGKVITISARQALEDAVMTVGFSKSKESIDAGFRRFHELAYQVRKTRMLGSAALAMAYIACGRLDAYIEEIISLWDVAAGILLVESAGGRVAIFSKDTVGEKYSLVASNGKLPLERYEAEMAAFGG